MSKVRYQALGPLLSGEGSRAFLGLATTDGAPAKPVVMIWVPPDTAQDPEQVAIIHRETARAVTLEHPNIIHVFGLASLDEGLARVVEFADGESLRRLLEVAGQLPPPFAALLACDVATGLHFAHLAGNDDGTALIHGDVRPETLMVCFSGFTKVSGYGALSVAPREAGGKRVVHRRTYSAPEQIIGGRNAISVQTDVYLLGLVLFECLTGAIPFQGEANFDQAVVQKPLTFSGYQEIPASLIPVLQRATSKRANERYPSVIAFREAIEASMGPLPTHDELAAWIEQQIPEGDAARAARRRVLDAGLADYAQRMWDPSKMRDTGAVPAIAPPDAVLPAPIKSGADRATGARPSMVVAVEKKPAAPRPVVRRVTPGGSEAIRGSNPNLEAMKPRSRRMVPIIVVTALAASGLSVFVVTSMSSRARSVEPARPIVAVVPVKLPEPEVKAPDSVAAVEPPKPVEPAVKPAAFKPPEPAKPLPPPTFVLEVTPAVDVSIDGKAMGRSPVTAQLTPGKHTVTLRDHATGINDTRTVMLQRTGKQTTQLSLKKGFLTVAIPDGALIQLDGKPLGKVSIEDVPIWEGSHKLVVFLGGAKWQQGFDVRADEHMKYNVQTQPE